MSQPVPGSAFTDHIGNYWALPGEGLGRSVGKFEIGPNGTFAVSGEGEATVRIWEIETGRELGTLRADTTQVGACAVSSDGSLVVSGGLGGTLSIWDVETGRMTRMKEHTHAVERLVALFAEQRGYRMRGIK